MKIEDHLNAYEEHKDAISWAIDRGLEKSQRIVGFHCSRAVIELLSAYLHKINIIEIGFQINHRWFKSEKISERFSDFSKKDLIIEKIIKLELQSENLIYGSQKTEKEIKDVLFIFNEIDKILNNLMENKNEK